DRHSAELDSTWGRNARNSARRNSHLPHPAALAAASPARVTAGRPGLSLGPRQPTTHSGVIFLGATRQGWSKAFSGKVTVRRRNLPAGFPPENAAKSINL